MSRPTYDFPSEPHEESQQRVSMTIDHFRWLLMWHTALVRDLMAIEVGRDGLERAKQRTNMLDRRRKAFLAQRGMLLPSNGAGQKARSKRG